MAKRGRRRLPPLCQWRPQTYEARVECALEAMGHALAGCGMLAQFLLAEQGPAWPRADLLDDARRDLHAAERWLVKARRFSQREGGKDGGHGRGRKRGENTG